MGFHLECATTAKKQQHVVVAILAVVVAVAGGAEVEVIEAKQMESIYVESLRASGKSYVS